MSQISKLALTSGLVLLTSSALAVTPLYPDSSDTQSRPSARPSYSQPAPARNTDGLQFPNTPAQIRAALKLDQNNRQLKSKTRSLADLRELRIGALVEFATDSTRIIPTVELDNLGKALSDLESGVRIEVVGHTDSQGNDRYNLDLSRKRAEAVKRHLISQYGVDRYALITRGEGEHRPIESNATSEGRQFNRRVEFVRIVE